LGNLSTKYLRESSVTTPFLRWAGGKRWLAKRLGSLIGQRLSKGGTYFEPFLGSGAMYFSHGSCPAVLSDLNCELINAFVQVARHPNELRIRLGEIRSGPRKYAEVRDASPSSAIGRAVRFLYLNRNCFAGIYRENLSGHFNVPYGGGDRTHAGLVRSNALERASRILGRTGIELICSDFEPIIDRARKGDVVYCDPTYRAVTREHFDRYGQLVFAWKDQQRLASAAQEAFARGAIVIVSNASCDGVRDLYPSASVFVLRRRKGLGSGKATELLFVLDPDGQSELWSSVDRDPTNGSGSY
jgi:DNA adenine methylase